MLLIKMVLAFLLVLAVGFAFGSFLPFLSGPDKVSVETGFKMIIVSSIMGVSASFVFVYFFGDALINWCRL